MADPREIDIKSVEMEQYKLYVEMADRISMRRGRMNMFYISIMTGSFALYAFYHDNLANDDHMGYGVILGTAGILLCIIWSMSIRAYAKLNTAKFKVIHEMEKNMPFSCYEDEWQFLSDAEVKYSTMPISKIESIVPAVMGVVFVIVLLGGLA